MKNKKFTALKIVEISCLTVFFLGSIFYGKSSPAAEPDAVKIIEQADRARGGLSSGLTWGLELISVENGKSNRFVYDLKVLKSKVLATCQEPARCRGESYLFLDRNLWVFRPGLRKPLSLSPRQRLSGQSANGDIATTNYSRDYSAEILGSENIRGQMAWKFKLKAKTSDLTYEQILYWVSEKNRLGLKADFLTLEGKTFKTADFEYNNSITIDGAATPFISKMTIHDAKNPELVSTLNYTKPTLQNLSEQIFNVNKISQ